MLENINLFLTYRITKFQACDPAGPYFDNDSVYSKLNPKDAALHVQCIHTSSDYGTLQRSCNIDWLMGECGLNQIAATYPPFGNHGLCPYFYNFAFENRFFAVPRPDACPADNHAYLPYTGIKNHYMGYQAIGIAR